jgi:S-adenosylmethionine:tRNA ribosyltransferase-isomerase
VRVSDFAYELPADRVAQAPASRRDGSRLMLLDRSTGATAHRRFSDLPELLRAGDLLVLNDTRVRRARLLGRRPTGGKAEVLLLEPVENRGSDAIWRCLVRSGGRTRTGERIELEGGIEAEVLERDGDAWRVLLGGAESLEERIERVGRMPLPPYIRRSGAAPPPVDDHERYQTVYARHVGAVAAPTAGLHFTPDLMERLEGRGVERAFLTLHVGPGTFVPVRTEDVERHTMHAERFELPRETADAVAAARRRGGRVIAVGTTVVRTLEAAAEAGRVRSGAGECDLFIYPGYDFRVVDAMITNFHLPCSTLLMLVAAFADRERVLAAYEEAKTRGYRFYSYGDAMLVGA